MRLRELEHSKRIITTNSLMKVFIGFRKENVRRGKNNIVHFKLTVESGIR